MSTMEKKAMAAYLKDIENNADLTSQVHKNYYTEIIKDINYKLNTYSLLMKKYQRPGEVFIHRLLHHKPHSLNHQRVKQNGKKQDLMMEIFITGIQIQTVS